MVRESHYFWAVRMPDSVKQTIHHELLQIKSIFPFKRWVDLHDFHITLAFLGSVSHSNFPQLLT